MREGFLVIANPASGSGRGVRVSEFVRWFLDKAGADYEFRFTSGPGDALRLAEKAVGRRSAVICIGGDGTVHEAAQALAHCDTPIGVIPAGTGNDFARVLDLPKGMEAQAGLVLSNNEPKTIDAGSLGQSGRLFVNVLGITAVQDNLRAQLFC